MRKPSRDDIKLLLFATSVSLVITGIAYTLALYMVAHHILFFR